MSKLTHLDARGAARMVDVTDKAPSVREATAEAVIVLSREAFEAVVSGGAKKVTCWPRPASPASWRQRRLRI